MLERQASRWRASFSAAAFSALLVAGCQSSSPEPQQMARTSLQTAPADLQLLCASSVATQTGTTSDKVLPVSSRQLDAKSYQVELDAAGKKHNCVVDSDGNVTSVTAI
jgi:hypothetical protein